MTAQIKLTLDETLANSLKETAKQLGYLSTQEFIVESARQRDIAYRLSGLKSLQGAGNVKYTGQEKEKLLAQFRDSGSEFFREHHSDTQ